MIDKTKDKKNIDYKNPPQNFGEDFSEDSTFTMGFDENSAEMFYDDDEQNGLDNGEMTIDRQKVDTSSEEKAIDNSSLLSKKQIDDEGENASSKTRKKQFVHLHVHSEYSLLDGAARITKGKKFPLIDECIANDMPAIAVTDHGSMYGVYSFYKACNYMKKEHPKTPVKPIIGCEFYTSDNMCDKTTKDSFHLLLLAKSEKGYENLVKLDSLAFTKGFYYKPRIDLELLAKHTEDVICLSACLGGKIPQYLLAGDYEAAKQYALTLKNMFGEGDFYIELQDHGLEEQKRTNPLLVKIAKEIGVKVVATNDVHYIKKEDAEMHDVLLCIQTGKTIDDTNRMRFETNEFYLKSYDEMYELFSWCPEALETTIEIADKCCVTISKHQLYPPYTPSNGQTPAEYLRGLSFEGLKIRYGEPLSQEIIDRANFELDTIIKMGFAEYYLIVWDFINYAQSNSIPVGAGRGSGVGSIIAYAIRITNVDPLKYNLLFERFLNPERVSPPDFDIDFCFEGRSKVKDYVVEKYGQDKVCEIITFGTLAAKAAIKDVARVYNIPFDTVNRVTKLVPMGKLTIEMVLGIDAKSEGKLKIPEFIELYKSDESIKKIVDMAIKIEGMPRNSSKHAAGVVICKQVISDFIPLQKNGDDITTQYQKEEVEELGMLKMDFLGLKTLTDIKKAKQYVLETDGKEIDFEKLGYDNPEVFKLIASGDTDAVFQLEGGGMKKFLKDLQPENLEDVIAGISLYRPGPMESIPKYVESKHNPKTISYAHPSLIPILNMTYGCIVYQEQVMQIVRELGGYTLGRADMLRRAMGKKKQDVMIAERNIFINGCPASKNETAVEGAINRGVPLDIANKIFSEMESFASYAFNKSHAAAYAVLSYETAFLKRFYPTHFITAVINNRITNAEEVAKYVNYLKDCKYQVFPPDINKSNVFFSVCEGGVRFGLTGVKNVGEGVIAQVIEERKRKGEFSSLYDFIKRTAHCGLNKRLIESLVYGGAFDGFGETRATNIASYEGMMSRVASDKKSGSVGQFSMFEMFGKDVEDAALTAIGEYKRNFVLAQEKSVLGVYISGHPLDEFRDELKEREFTLKAIEELLQEVESDEGEENESVDLLRRQFDDRQVSLIGLISDVRKRPTKTGKTMAVCQLEDLHGAIEVVFFPAAYEKAKLALTNDNIVVVRGRLKTMDRKPNMLASDVAIWQETVGDDTAESNDSEDIGGVGSFLNGMGLKENGRKNIFDSVAYNAKSFDDKADKKRYNSKEQDSKFSKESKKESTIYIRLDDEDMIAPVCGILERRKGSQKAYIKLGEKLFDTTLRVNGSKALFLDLWALLGEENVKVVEKK